MISPEEYRKKYEGGERLSETDSLDRHIKQLEAENRKLRDAIKKLIGRYQRAYESSDHYDQLFYEQAVKDLRRLIAKKALSNEKT